MSYPLYIKALISYIEVHSMEKRLDYARLEKDKALGAGFAEYGQIDSGACLSMRF